MTDYNHRDTQRILQGILNLEDEPTVINERRRTRDPEPDEITESQTNLLATLHMRRVANAKRDAYHGKAAGIIPLPSREYCEAAEAIGGWHLTLVESWEDTVLGYDPYNYAGIDLMIQRKHDRLRLMEYQAPCMWFNEIPQASKDTMRAMAEWVIGKGT